MGDIEIKHLALRAVGRIGACDARGDLADFVPMLCSELKHEEHLTRRIAAGDLFNVGAPAPETSVPALVYACDDESLLDVALLALIKIGKAARSAATPCSRRLATNPNGCFCSLAIRGLSAIGSEDAASREILTMAVSIPNRCVQALARQALSKTDPP